MDEKIEYTSIGLNIDDEVSRSELSLILWMRRVKNSSLTICLDGPR